MIQFMRGESSAVSANDPVLAAGQPFYELDTHKLKIGDGSSNYSSLDYVEASQEGLTQDQADQRYLKLSGGTPAGALALHPVR